ncbi:MAG TPA: cation:proton antiporter [Bacteroidales bacterium]|nr:cation:proton antiporter [Bacteroidales bacterium]
MFSHMVQEFQLPLSNPVLVFSTILFIILLAPILLRRLNIPGIVGLILSGVIIGPHGFNILENNSAVDLFSTIGLLYIMFIAGLDLDISEFRSNRFKSILFGAYTFVLPISIGFPLCYYVLDYDFLASLLTASMFATHTLVAYPIVSRLGVVKNQAVAVAVGGTILTDTAVLLILAIVVGKAGGSLDHDFWLRLSISFVVFLLIMFTVIPRLTRWFFSKLESEKHGHYIFVLSVVFFAAFLAEMAGVEPIIGAFVAGLALNPLIPHSSALMNRIEFIGNSLFIPFFLISVGMIIDVRVILSGPTAIIVALVLTVGALIGKWLAAWLTQVSFRYSAAQRGLIFGLSASHAAATLAVILVGFRAGILDENILNGTIILILITCVVASFATDRAARKVLKEGHGHELSRPELTRLQHEHILMPIADMDRIEKYLEFVMLIKDRKSIHPVTILSVVPNNQEAGLNVLRARKKLEEFKKHVAAVDIPLNALATIDHNPASGIARIAREVMADTVVLGWPRKAGIIDRITGAMMNAIISRVDRTLFICYIDQPIVSRKRILVVAPPLAEQEYGFQAWLMKVVKLAQELKVPVRFLGDENTWEGIREEVRARGINLNLSFEPYNDWDELESLKPHLNGQDLLVFVAARRSAVSYSDAMENIPARLDRHFDLTERVLVFPQQYYDPVMLREDLSTGPLVKGIEALESLGKGIGKALRR